MKENSKFIKRSSRFKEITMDEGGRLYSETMAKAGELDVLVQVWSLDGIAGQSVIFANEDVEGLSDEEIKSLVKEEFSLNEKMRKELTISNPSIRKKTGFTFVNFNFAIL